MATIHITLVISHKGKFVKGDDGKLAYVGGEKTEIERVNVDTLNKFFMNDLVKNIGYNDVSELYWLEPGKELDGGLRLFRLDMDVVTMYEATIANGRRVEVFTEHPVELPEFVEENNEPEPELEILTVNRTPVKHRTNLCVRRPPTPKKKRKRVVKLSETVGGVPGPDAQTEDAVVDKEVHHTRRNTQQPDLSHDQPNIPTHSAKVTFDEAPIHVLQTGHNSRSCSKKNEAMAGSAGGQSSNQHPAAEDDENEAARLEEMFWEETLEAVEAAASQPPPETTPVSQLIPNPVRSPSTRPSTAKKPPKKKKNLQRPPPTTHQPQYAPATPTTTTPSPPASDVPPTVTPQTMQAASQGTTSRFMEFMPTPTGRGSSSSRWPQPAFRPPPKKRSTTAHLKEGSSGSSNSTPIP